MGRGNSVSILPGPLALPGRRCPSRKTMALSYSRTTCRGKQKLGWSGRHRTRKKNSLGCERKTSVLVKSFEKKISADWS